MADGHRIYQCLLCQFISANVASVAAHTRDAHGPQGKYQCCYCNFSIDNLKLIQHHQETTHPNQRIAIDVLYLEELNVAPQQDVVLTINKAIVAVPKAEPVDMSEAPKQEKMLRCLQCPFMVPTADRLRQHMRCHNNHGKYQCRECDFSTNEPTLLLEHAMVHEPGYSGSSASAVTAMLGNLHGGAMNLSRDSSADRHSDPSTSGSVTDRSQSAKEPSQTKALDLSMEVSAQDQALNEQAKSLTQRMRAAAGSSGGRIRYRCSECPYHTFCRNNIVKHRRQHLISNRYQCRYCSYSATRAFLLQQHERFHNEEESAANSSDVSPSKHYQDLILDPFDPTLESCMVGEDDMDIDHEEDEVDTDAEVDEVMGTATKQPPLKRTPHTSGQEKAADKEAKEIMEAEAANASGKSTPTSGLDAAILAEKQFRTYKCQHCPFSSNSSFEFRKHCRFHGMQNRYKCDRCSYSLDRLNLLTQHRKLHSDEPDFDPNPPTSQLLNHEAILKPLSTSETESMQVSLNDEDHNLIPSPKPSSPAPTIATKPEASTVDELLVCPSCPYKTQAQKAFAIHSSMHGLKRKYICDFCDWSADRLSLLYQHRRVHASDPDFDTTPIDSIFLNHEFAEDVPGEFEAKILDLGASKDGGQPSAAGPTTSIASSLSPPFKLSITKKMYTCQHCPFVTGNRASFDYHQAMHSGPGCYACDSCSYRTERWSLLCQHNRLHEQPGDEDVLEKAKGSQELNAEEPQKESTADRSESHEDENVEKEASEGEKSEARESSATSPVMGKSSTDITADSADSELRCQRCPFSASSKPDLIQHVQRHAGPGTMVCPYCDFTGSDEDALLPHFQVHFTAPLDLDLDNLRHMLKQQRKEATSKTATKDKSATLTKTSMDTGAKKTAGEATSVKSVEPARKEEAASATDGGVGPPKGDDVVMVSQKTKVYVCQYCEREFEAKAQMIQHERQHLV
nr:hypothetical protein BaRGS_014520 [Batillaria attramentaria]